MLGEFHALGESRIYVQNVEIYCAPTADHRENWLASMQHIDRENSAFVISVMLAVEDSDIPKDFPSRDQIAPGPDQ